MRVGDPDGYGRYGMMDGDDQYLVCHECGERKKSVGAHLASHGMTAAEYRAAHGLPRGMPLVARGTSAKQSATATARVGGEDWERFVAKRDPTAASHARTQDSYERRGADKQRRIETAKANIKGVRKPRRRRCPICGTIIMRKDAKTCSDLCARIARYESSTDGSGKRYAELYEAGESYSAIGRAHGVSHTAVRTTIAAYRRYQQARADLAVRQAGG